MNSRNEFEIEKNELVEKIQKRNEIIKRLINENHRVRLLNSDQINKLEGIYQKNEKFKQKLISNEFEIAIVGLEKAGKSTFANALIKSTILPSAPERCTFTSTRLVSGSDKARVQFYTEAQFEDIFQELLKEVEYIPTTQTNRKTIEQEDSSELSEIEKSELKVLKESLLKIEREETFIQNPQVKQEKIEKLKNRIFAIESKKSKPIDQLKQNAIQASFRNLSLTEFDNYFSSLETKNPALFKNHIGKTDEEIKDILKCRDRLNLTGDVKNFSGEELKNDAFQAYIKGENQGKDTSKPRSVRSIEIESSELKELSNAVIYDVPGFDSPTKIHLRQTEERLKAADAIILVTNAGTNPSLQGTTLSVITKNTDEDGIFLKDKLFVFGNQLDRVNDVSQLQGNTDILISDVEKYKIGERKRVFTGSAYKYLSDENIIPKINLHHDVESGIDNIRNALIQYYQSERFEILKRKIYTNQKSVQSILEDVLINSDLDENFSENSEQAKITKSAYREAEENLRFSLKKLQDELKKDIYEEKYFTNKFDQFVSTGNYFPKVSYEDFELRRILSDDSVRLDLAIGKINQNIRSSIHKKYLENFTHLVKKMTDEKIKEIEGKILTVFTFAICGNNLSTYEKIEALCKKYINKITHEVAHNDNSFTYLLERFSRDLFDALLSSPILSQDRSNRYIDSQKEFSYLDSYYSGGKGNLVNSILIQKKESLLASNTVNSIADIANVLRKAAIALAGQSSYVQAIDGILNILQNTNSTFIIKDSTGIDAILKQGKSSTTSEQVLREINLDIENLQHILRIAVIPAANLELAFLNGIDKQIKRLIAAFEEKDSFYSNAWDDFIAKIIPIVKKSEFDHISNRIETNNLQKDLLNKIKEIVNSQQ